jgi:RNA polymerase sigma-70 factor (ECF subfamily)
MRVVAGAVAETRMRTAAVDGRLSPAASRGVVGVADPARVVRSAGDSIAGADATEADRAEGDLIDAARSGDSLAFDTLVERHLRKAYAVAYRLLGQRQDAEDVVQDAFLAALTKLDTFERGRPFAPWLLRIVANRALNLRKSRALRQVEPIPVTAAASDASPHDAAERSQLRGQLEQALAALPEQQRWIVQLFEIDGFTSPEIAGMLEIAEGTVRWHLHQARHALRAALGHFATRTP